VHGEHLRPGLLLQPATLQQTHTVLAGDRATDGDRLVHDLLEGRLSAYAGGLVVR